MGHKIVTKAEALKQGLKTYYTGKPCPKGHIDEIFVKGRCRTCTLEATAARRRKAKTGKSTKSKAVVASGKPTNGSNVAEGQAWGGLVRRLKVLIEKGDKAAEKAEQFYKSAGLTIKEIKEKFPDNWEAIVRDECGIGRSRAYELISIADGRATLASIRASTNERQKTLKAKSRSVITDRPEVAPMVIGVKVIERQDEPRVIVATVVEAEPVEVRPPQDADIAESEAAQMLYIDTDDEPTLARKIVMVIGKERAALLIVELQKLIRAEAA
jgi:hypothetical protein